MKTSTLALPSEANTETSFPSLNQQNQPLFASLPFKHAYGPKDQVGLTFPEQGKTKQSFKDECDINVIMRRFEQTGELPLNQRRMLFGDCPDLDFQGAMQVVTEARERFMALPSSIRDRFANDPARLLSFINDPANLEEGIKLGLLQKRQDQSAAPANGGIATPPPAPAPAPASEAPAATPKA